MHQLASWNKLREYISWILPRINFLDIEPLLRKNEVVFDVNHAIYLMNNECTNRIDYEEEDAKSI